MLHQGRGRREDGPGQAGDRPAEVVEDVDILRIEEEGHEAPGFPGSAAASRGHTPATLARPCRCGRQGPLAATASRSAPAGSPASHPMRMKPSAPEGMAPGLGRWPRAGAPRRRGDPPTPGACVGSQGRRGRHRPPPPGRAAMPPPPRAASSRKSPSRLVERSGPSRPPGRPPRPGPAGCPRRPGAARKPTAAQSTKATTTTATIRCRRRIPRARRGCPGLVVPSAMSHALSPVIVRASTRAAGRAARPAARIDHRRPSQHEHHRRGAPDRAQRTRRGPGASLVHLGQDVQRLGQGAVPLGPADEPRIPVGKPPMPPQRLRERSAPLDLPGDRRPASPRSGSRTASPASRTASGRGTSARIRRPSSLEKSARAVQRSKGPIRGISHASRRRCEGLSSSRSAAQATAEGAREHRAGPASSGPSPPLLPRGPSG